MILHKKKPGTMSLSGITKFDRFWVYFENGNIAFGRHGKEVPLMNCTDPNPLDVKYVGVFTGFGSKGRWKFHSFCHS